MTLSTPELFAVGRYVDVFNRALTFAPPALRGMVNALQLRRGSCFHLHLATHGVSTGPGFALRCRHGLFEIGPDVASDGRTITIDRAHLYEVINTPWRFVGDPRRFELCRLLAARRPDAHTDSPAGLMRAWAR